jgi:hypothetical protein
MTYNATVRFSYINDTDSTPSEYFPEIVDKHTITIEAPAQDLNVHQHFELFKAFLRAMDFNEYSILDGACRIAFNDSNDEAQMKKLMEEYELQDKQDSYLSHKETEEICKFMNGKESAWNEIKDNRVRETLQLYIDRDHRVYDKLEAEIRDLKAKLSRALNPDAPNYLPEEMDAMCAENTPSVQTLKDAEVVCKDCGSKYGHYSVSCSSTWIGKCNVCGKDKPVTEVRDWGYLAKGIGELKK